MTRHACRTFAAIPLLLFALLALSLPAAAEPSYRKGQYVEPAYEGWWENDDGSFSLVFGYHNENWEEELDITVGEGNFFSPGEADRGQPQRHGPP